MCSHSYITSSDSLSFVAYLRHFLKLPHFFTFHFSKVGAISLSYLLIPIGLAFSHIPLCLKHNLLSVSLTCVAVTLHDSIYVAPGNLTARVWVRRSCCLSPGTLRLSHQSRAHGAHIFLTHADTFLCFLRDCIPASPPGYLLYPFVRTETLVLFSLLYLRVRWDTQGMAKVNSKAQVTSPASFPED